jgi:hypothetical protein
MYSTCVCMFDRSKESTDITYLGSTSLALSLLRVSFDILVSILMFWFLDFLYRRLHVPPFGRACPLSSIEILYREQDDKVIGELLVRLLASVQLLPRQP